MNLRDKFNAFKQKGHGQDDEQDEVFHDETLEEDYEAYDDQAYDTEFEEDDEADFVEDHEDGEQREEITAAAVSDDVYGEYENLKNRKYSRSSRNKEETASPLTKVLLVVLLLLFVIPLMITVWARSRSTVPEPESAEQVMVSKTQNVSASKAEEESRQKELEEKESEAARLASEKSRRESESKEKSDQENASKSDASSVASTPQTIAPQANQAGTYTVQSGDNLYRIAINNGISLDQLLSLNGLNQNSYIAPGMVLRVR